MPVQAELRGKLSRRAPALELWEDVLTASVFGLLRYLDPEILLIPALNRAKRLSGKRVSPLSPIAGDAEIEFWPKLPNGREPDVLIKFRVRGIWQSTIVIEAKYRSGKSDGAATGDDDDDEEEEEEEEERFEEERTQRVGDQLADQVLGIDEAGYPSPSLLYLTAHPTMPESDLLATCDALLGERHREVPLRWLNWDAFAVIAAQTPDDSLAPRDRLIVKDIYDLLVRRGCGQFTGFRHVLRIHAAGWEFRATGTEWFANIPAVTHCLWRFSDG